jgi:hypothetical protein
MHLNLNTYYIWDIWRHTLCIILELELDFIKHQRGLHVARGCKFDMPIIHYLAVT